MTNRGARRPIYTNTIVQKYTQSHGSPVPCLPWYINTHKRIWYRYRPVAAAPSSLFFRLPSPSLAVILQPPGPSTICVAADHADPTRNCPRTTRARLQQEARHQRRPVPTNLSTAAWTHLRYSTPMQMGTPRQAAHRCTAGKEG